MRDESELHPFIAYMSEVSHAIKALNALTSRVKPEMSKSQKGVIVRLYRTAADLCEERAREIELS